jgi:pimeloyl-ACP methyl ester carboxylesterase
MTNQNTALSTHRTSLPDGRTLTYTISGVSDGYPVIAHHGTPGSRLFAAILSTVATEENVRLIVPDRPGYGRSSPPPSDWTWWDWQDDLAELLHTESINRAAVMGFSGGGPFALAAANSEWASRLGLVSTVLPPANNGLTKLSKIPFAVRLLFRCSKALASVGSDEMVVKQYTDRSVSEAVAAAIGADFREALQQGAKAVERENRSFAGESIPQSQLPAPIHAWHGVQDENTSLPPVREFIDNTTGTLVTGETDHLGTLLDYQRDVFKWLSAG